MGFGGPVRAGATPTTPWVVARATRRLSVGRGHCWRGSDRTPESVESG